MARGDDRPDVRAGGPLALLDRYPTTLGVALACALVFGAAARRAPGLAPDAEALDALGALAWPAVRAEPWRLLAAPFLHAAPLHLALNALATWQLGRPLEVHLGSARLWLVWVAAAVGGGLATAARQALLGGAPSVGASGATLGLVAAALVLARRAPARLGSLAAAAAPWALGVVAASLVAPAGVDHAAHVGGAAVGALAAARLDLRPGAGGGAATTAAALALAAAALASVAAGALRAG